MKGYKVRYFEKLDSTNKKAISYPVGSVIVAKEQSGGKGRFRRKWCSSRGGIYMSIVTDAYSPNYLTLIAAIAVNRSIEDACGIKTMIKWPNDLLFKKKKISGILTVISQGKAVVGIGINTNNALPGSLYGKAGSLQQFTGSKIDNRLIINNIISCLDHHIGWLKDKRYDKILSEWKNRSFIGHKIIVKTLKKTVKGTAYDIDEDCFLIVKDNKGKKKGSLKGTSL